MRSFELRLLVTRRLYEDKVKYLARCAVRSSFRRTCGACCGWSTESISNKRCWDVYRPSHDEDAWCAMGGLATIRPHATTKVNRNHPTAITCVIDLNGQAIWYIWWYSQTSYDYNHAVTAPAGKRGPAFTDNFFAICISMLEAQEDVNRPMNLLAKCWCENYLSSVWFGSNGMLS